MIRSDCLLEKPLYFVDELFDEDELITLYYDCPNNILVDEDGFIIYDVFAFVTPSELALFKHNRECAIFRNIELIWPEFEDQDLHGDFYNY